MLERDKIIGLYEIYKNLLTDKQRDYFENYYYEDLSLSEIAENFEVSKTIVSKTLKQVESKLTELEETLGLNKLYDDLVNLKNNININDKNKIEKIIEDNFKI
ncbi:MAG: DNA-binding protein [Tenericutes bacterium]|nr:DNA-binding protein [Mycoplasmatota bacterium]